MIRCPNHTSLEQGWSWMARKSQQASDSILAKLQKARIARLATLDSQRRPHIVPVCFVYEGSVFYTAAGPQAQECPARATGSPAAHRGSTAGRSPYRRVSEDWEQLWFILVRGQASLIATSAHQERAGAIRQLKEKYPQYAAGMLGDDAPIVRITPERISSWGRI